MAALADTYARYVPALILDRVVREAKAVDHARIERFDCVVMFADISGFTPLTERFAKEGPSGAERLTQILNDYFSRLIDVVRAHQGDIVKFAGDALIAVWRAADSDDDLADAVSAASRCGLGIQQELKHYRVNELPLQLRIAIGSGVVGVIHVGGEFDRWEFAITGEPLNQVGLIGDYTEPGEVMLSHSAWELVREHAEGEILETNGLSMARLSEFEPQGDIKVPQPAPIQLTESMEDILKSYLPAAIHDRIAAGQREYLGELRWLTILFVNLPDINYDTPLDIAQQAMRRMQQALYFPFEGSINKLSVDDKGVSLIAALGLPPYAHEDDPSRGALAAVAIHDALDELGLERSIGVSTGRVYCGSVGSPLRQEYTIMGDSVNLAARLMQNAGGSILCDRYTYDRAHHEVEFIDAGEFQLKGKSYSINAYRPVKARSETIESQHELVTVGRAEEHRQLKRALTGFMTDRHNRIIIIEGEPGMGKSQVMEDFLSTMLATPGLADLEPPYFLGKTDQVGQNSPYYAWSGILSTRLGPDPQTRTKNLVAELGEDPELHPLLPLINSALPTELEETALIHDMPGDVRAANTQRLILKLLERSAQNRPLIIVIDDAQWIDSASWELLYQSAQHIQPLLILLVTRPTGRDAAKEYQQLSQQGNTEIVRLERMSEEETLALVSLKLGVVSLPPPAATLILERAEGHPFFSEELGYALRDTGVIRIEEGQCEMAGDIESLDLPHTIEGIITSRIDRLSAGQQLTLKVASVIGREFGLEVLESVYPVAEQHETVKQQLEALNAVGLTVATSDKGDTFRFKQIATWQVSYDLMLYAQRKGLHEAIASWFESTPGDRTSYYYPIVAYHYLAAERYDDAIGYYERAAE